MDTSRDELADRVHSLAIHLLRRVRGADVESGLSAARLSALSVLVYGGGRSLTELADSEQVTAATMSRLVTGLEGSGLVARRPDASDGRRVRVEATARGAAVLEAARSRRVATLAALLSEIGPTRRSAVAEAVEILEAALASS